MPGLLDSIASAGRGLSNAYSDYAPKVGQFTKDYGQTIVGLGKLGLDYRADRKQNRFARDSYEFNKSNILAENARRDATTGAAGDALAESALLDRFGRRKKETGLGSVSSVATQPQGV